MKKGVARWLPVSLIDSAGAPVLSKAYGDVVVEYCKEGAVTLTTKNLLTSDWKELGQGRYKVLFSDVELNTKGGFDYVVTGTGFIKYDGWFDLEDSNIDDIKTDAGTIIAKTNNLPADPASNTQVNTRLAGASYVAPANSDITAIKAKTDNLPALPSSEPNATTNKNEILANITSLAGNNFNGEPS